MDKNLLLAKRADTASGLPEMDVELGELGTVRIRALNRLEAMYVQAADEPAEQERRALSIAMLDPTMTLAEVGAWQKVALAGELSPVAEAVTEISGMGAGASKQAVKDFEADASTEFRVLPSGTSGHDGGAAEDGDQ